MRILLFGADGQLGTDLNHLLKQQGDEVIPSIQTELDICDFEAVNRFVDCVAPDAIVNTAAYHKVEDCEANPEIAFAVNALAVCNLARAAARLGCILVHFSTDYVFDGSKATPYLECDLPVPLNVYGASKVAGEHLIAFNTERYLIIRTSGLYGLAGSAGKGGNFVENMLKRAAASDTLHVVHDQVLTPTYTVDLALMVWHLIHSRHYGLFHVTSEGQCSWYEFTREFCRIEGVSVNPVPVTTDEFPSPVKRPKFSVLSKERLGSLGLGLMPCWQDALSRYLRSRQR
jgi:dTDP-4-dehydrorhamnose reductase